MDCDIGKSSNSDSSIWARPQSNRLHYNDVLPHRLASGVNVTKSSSSAEIFKSCIAKSKPRASSNFYHSHLNAEAKARIPSSLADAIRYITPKIINLCVGLPSPRYFPFEALSFEVADPSVISMQQTKILSARKYDVAEAKSAFDLSIALNYGHSMGAPQLMRYLTEHTELVHAPPYSDWEICLTQGSISALDVALRMFCSEGDSILYEEYSFSTAIESALFMGLKLVGLKMDEKGLCASDLEYVLSNWDSGACLGRTKYGGASRPKVIYCVPTGQNPTGATQDEERRRAVLQICERYQVFILEDDPYYFLQMDEYVCENKHRQSNVKNGCGENGKSTDLEIFLDSLIPSYLSLSKTGNVLRLDSFSKVLAPGMRAGWVTGPANIVRQFIRASEVSALGSNGFSMMAIYKLLEEEWGHEGFFQWLRNLRIEYTARRDGLMLACQEYLPQELVLFRPPMAGMFHWLQVDGTKHPIWQQRSQSFQSRAEQTAFLIDTEDRIFRSAAEKGVLIAKGSWFRVESDCQSLPQIESVNFENQTANPSAMHGSDIMIYFRLTFASAPHEKIVEAIKLFGEVLRGEFGTVEP